MECFIMVHHNTVWHEMPIMNWMLSDTWSHKCCYAQKYSILNWNWYIHDQSRVCPESTSNLHKEVSTIPGFLLLLLCLLSFCSNLWPCEELPNTSWHRKKCGPGSNMDKQALSERGELQHYTSSLGYPWNIVVKFFQWTKIHSMNLIAYIYWQKICTYMELYTVSWAVAYD